MADVVKASGTPPKVQPEACTWMQITFTLDHEHYRKLWERAEAEHRSVPSLVHESVIDFLMGAKVTSRKKRTFAKQNAGDLL